MHMVAASCHDALVWSLTPGQTGDGPEGMSLIEAMGCQYTAVYLLMDSAYEGDEPERQHRRVTLFLSYFLIPSARRRAPPGQALVSPAQ